MAGSVPTWIGDLSFASVIIGLVVVLLAIDVYIRVMTAAKTYRDEKKRRNHPVDVLETKVSEHDEQLVDHDKKLRRDHDRLNTLEDGNRVMMRAMLAMLSHEINGNSTDKLQNSMDEIQKYLVNR